MLALKNIPLLTLFITFPIFLWSQEDKISILIKVANEEKANGAPIEQLLASWLKIYDNLKGNKDHPQFENACYSIAHIYEQEQLYENALDYYLDALKSNKGSIPIELSQHLARTYSLLSKPDSAYYYYNHILAFKEKTGNINGQINLLQEIARSYGINGHYNQAITFEQRILQLVESHNRSKQERLQVLNNLGNTHNQLKQYEKSITNFEKAIRLLEEGDLTSKAILLINIGVAYHNLGESALSINYLLKAKKIKDKIDPNSLDELNQLLATAYFKNKDLYNAMKYSELSEELALSNNNDLLLVDIYYTGALIHLELYEYDVALDLFQKHLELRDTIELVQKLRQQRLLQQKADLERAEKRIKLFMVNEDVKELTIKQLKTEAESQRKEKELLQKDNEIKVSKLKIQISEAQRSKQELELVRQRLTVSDLQQNEALQQLEIKNKEAQLMAEQNEKSLLIRDNEINTLELQKRKEKEQYFYGIGGLLTLIMIIVVIGLIYSRKLNLELNRKNTAIEQEKKKSDELLLNILPESVAFELKDTGKATTKKYKNVTILFTDFKDFTKLVASIPATKLVEELNDIFSKFDDIVEELEIEKIETIGDAYMAACGLPEENSDHALKCVSAAFRMIDYLKHRNKINEIQWNMRVGVHSGPVVAGVVGKRKFAYDIFGDTVNTASRMETNSEIGRVNISEKTYAILKNESSLQFESRGEIHAKGKGELEMWFVRRNQI